jgi:ubiquinone biosynthesis protein Coq4
MTADLNGKFIQKFLAAVDQVSDRLGISVPAVVNLESLRQLPSGTLGRSLADHLDQQQFQPFTTGPRRKQLHDAVHVLTGYDTSPIGEAEVQAFLLGAKFHPVQIALGLGTVRLIYKSCSPCPHLWQRIGQAYQRGQASSFDVDLWQPETQWALPLSQVQSLFCIETGN